MPKPTFAVLLCLTACGVLDPPELDAFETVAAKLSTDLARDLPAAFRRYAEASTNFAKPAEAEASRVQTRNDLAGKILFIVDYHYQQYVDSFAAKRGGTKLVLETAAITTAGAATVTTPEAVARLLAAISTMFQAVDKATDDHVFMGMAAASFVTQTQRDRAEIRTRILKSLNLPSVEYSIYECASDLALYAEAGNINTPAARIQEQNGAAARKAKDGLDQLRNRQVQAAQMKQAIPVQPADQPWWRFW